MTPLPPLDFTPTLVLYHGRCPDGFGAAWVLHERFGDAPLYKPAVHPEPPCDDEVRNQDIVVVDVSFSREEVERIHRLARRLLILDHHASAATDLAGLEYAGFDMSRSGVGLAWDACFPGVPRPLLVDLVESRDLWRHGDDQARLLGVLDSLPFEFGAWSAFRDMLETPAGLAQIEIEGRAIDRAFQVMLDHAEANARRVHVHGLRGWVVNAPRDMASFLCARLYARPDTDFSMSWYQSKEGEASCSWRASRASGVNLIPIAKLYGGGGHPQAVGCRMSMSELEALFFPSR